MVEKIVIENLRREALGAIVDERKSIIISRKRKLQELYAVCRHVERSKAFPNGDIIAAWGTVEDYGGANMEDAEKRFLEENDMDRGRLFNESTLPQHFSYPPEPGGFAKQTPTPAPKRASKSPTPATPLKSVVSPLTPALATDETLHAGDSRIQDPELPVEKRLRHSSYVGPVPLDQTVGPPLSNGKKQEVDHDTSMDDHSVTDLKTEPSSERAPSPKQKSIPVAETAKLDTVAPVVDVGGIPVIQETVTRIPDEKEKSMGVRPPPVPTKLVEQQDQDVSMEDTAPTSESAVPIVSPTKTVAPSPEPELEIPDSQETPQDPISSPTVHRIFPHLEEARLPAYPSQLQQLPPHAPLVVVTTRGNRHSPIPFASPTKIPTLQPEVSSPTSSIDDAETPGNAALSSATSPDASHMALEHTHDGKGEAKEVISEVGGDRVEIVTEEQARKDEDAGIIAEKEPECCGDKPSAELPSVSAAEDVVEAEAETEIALPTIQPQEFMGRDADMAVQEEQEIEALPDETEVLAFPVAKSPAVPRDQTPTTPVKPSEASNAKHDLPLGQPTPNSSPDPSAQLRLEHQLANGAPVPPTNMDITKPISVPQSMEPEPESVVMHHHEEEEEEDEVQLVGSREPEPSIRQRTPVETPVRTPVEPRSEIVEVVKETVEEVLQTEAEEVPIHVPSPGPAEVVKDNVDRVDDQPERAASEPVEEQEQEDEEGDEEGEEEQEEEEEEEDEKEDVVMGEAQHDEPESISVPYQPSPAPAADTDPDVDAEGEDEEEIAAEVVEGRPHEEHEPMDISEEKTPEKSLDPAMRSIPSPTEEKDEMPESITEQKIVPPVTSTPIVDKTAEKVAETITDTKPITAVGFGLPTPDATNAQPSAPASTAAISPLRQRSLKAFGRQKEREKSRSKLRKVVISSAHHAAAAAEAEAQRLREDQENQGMIVVARRREQAASAAARGRGAPFPTGSRTEVITRYGIVDTPPADINLDKKNVEIFDVLYTVKSSQSSAKDLISRASKTVSTSNHQVHYFESQAARILATIQKMQDEGLHSLRQIERAREPKRRKCHWDYLIEEAKWLREDFKEERRWKIAVAKQVVEWVVEWHEAGEDRRELCVDRRRWGRVPKRIREERRETVQGDVDMAGSGSFGGAGSQPTPELVTGGATPEDEGSEDYFQGQDEHGAVGWGEGRDFFGYLQDPPPAAIFTLGPEETVFGVAPTKAAEDMLGQLPLFAPPKPPNPESLRFECVEEEWMTTSIIPVTKYCTGKLALEQEEEGPPRKKSRYEYEENYQLFADDSDEDDAISGGSYIGQHGKRERDRTRKPVPLPPEQTNVALFSPNSKNLLQRIHNAHLFRPPSDPPPAAFFESRTPSLWTAAEDEMLKQLAREYHHNWSLVATCMALEGTWHSGSERRSPWECFERWIGLEPVNPDFMKSPYYKSVQQRLDIAARVGGMYVSANPGSAGGSNQQGPMTKRRGTVPMKVEKRRVTKYFNIFEAMRKLAKKRETSISKQQSGRAAQIIPTRKSDLPNNPSQKTPAFFSHLKFERDLKQQEQKAMYTAHMQTMQARGQPIAGMPQAGRLHPAQQQAIVNGVPIPGARIQQAAGMSNGIPQTAKPSPNVPHATPNGVVPVGMNGLPVNLQGHPQAPMQQGRLTVEQIARLRMQAKAQLQGQQGYSQQPGSVAQMQPDGYQSTNPQAVKALLIQQAQQAALGGQKMSSIPNGQAGSPRMQQQPLNVQQQQGGPDREQGLQLTTAEMIVLVQHQHPNLPQDQIAKAAAQHIANYHRGVSQNMARNQNSNGQATVPSPVQATSQQLFQRVQVQQQARAAAANTGPMMSVTGPVGPGANVISRSATPQQQRSGSAQSSRSVQQSPSLGQQQQGQPGQPGQGQ